MHVNTALKYIALLDLHITAILAVTEPSTTGRLIDYLFNHSKDYEKNSKQWLLILASKIIAIYVRQEEYEEAHQIKIIKEKIEKLKE